MVELMVNNRSNPAKITGVILCGGAGSRLAGADKPLLSVEGEPMVERVMRSMLPCVDEVVISCNRNLDRYRTYGHRIIVDEVADQGPLEGLRCALLQCRTDWLMSAPGDCPFVNQTIFERLRSVDIGSAQVKVAFDGHRQQNLFCLMHRSVGEVVSSQLSKGVRSVSKFLDLCDTACVDCSDLASGFLNVNEPSDMERL